MSEPTKRIIGCGVQAGLTVALLIIGFVLAFVVLLGFWVLTN